MTPYRIALANLRYPANPEESITLATAAIAEAAKQGAQILCFPECFIPGYSIGAEPLPAPPSPEFLARAHSTVVNAAAQVNITVILGTERYLNGARFLTALINNDGTIAGWQDKVQLDPAEDDAYAPASERHIFQSDRSPSASLSAMKASATQRRFDGLHAKEHKSSSTPTSIGRIPAALCRNNSLTPVIRFTKKPCSAGPRKTTFISLRRPAPCPDLRRHPLW